MIDTSETIVQSTALLDEESADSAFIRHVHVLANKVSEELENAIAQGKTNMSRVFDRNYRLIPYTDPEQFMTESTTLMDEIMPPIQEPVLGLDPSRVLCRS